MSNNTKLRSKRAKVLEKHLEERKFNEVHNIIVGYACRASWGATTPY